MNNIKILDCTLRDGGYCNNWNFGRKNIKKIVRCLSEAKIDIIECGFISSKADGNPNISKFRNVIEISKCIEFNENQEYVAMINYGDYDVNNLSEFTTGLISGIRLAFHKKDMYNALKNCEIIKEKGYKVFIQAMVSTSYIDSEFIELINMVNKINPYAFYIVDSFGTITQKELLRLFYITENNLNENIWIGFHSHNNMQLSYSNAQYLTNIQTHRNIIIDSSTYGMGRGAGNLNTEIFINYLNTTRDSDYKLKPLLTVIDEILNNFHQKNYWGFSLSNYLSALHNVHPNYAGYLDDKRTINVDDINNILDMIPIEHKHLYNKEVIEKLYFDYMNRNNKQLSLFKITKIFSNHKILLIAPGKSTDIQKNEIENFINQNNPLVISINHNYKNHKVDYIFFSNLRRYREFNNVDNIKCIIASNIKIDNDLNVNYSELLNSHKDVEDNAGLMAIKMLILCNIKEVYLAGFDGYSLEYTENYADKELEIYSKPSIIDSINNGMAEILSEYKNHISINFITLSKFNKQ